MLWVWRRCGLLDTAVSAVPNSATHLRVGIMSWFEFNEMEKKRAIQFYSCESHPNPLNFSIAWFSTSKEYREWLFFSFVSKGSNWFGTSLGFTLRLTANVKSGIENFTWKKRKKLLFVPVEFSVELAYFWQHRRDKCCHINKEQVQSLPLY